MLVINRDPQIIENAINKGSRLNKPVEIKILSYEREHYLGMSEISNCPRLLWFKFNKIEEYNGIEITQKETADKLHRIFRMGHILEQEVIHLMDSGGLRISGQQNTYTDFANRFRGHCDGLVKINGECRLFDIKTMNQNKFEMFCDGNIKSLFFSYWCQLNMYMYYENNYKPSFLIAYNKNTSDIKVRTVEYEPTLVKFMINKCDKILQSTSPSDIIVGRANESCMYCPYSSICNSIDNPI